MKAEATIQKTETIYIGEDFEKAVTNQIKFLKKSFGYY